MPLERVRKVLKLTKEPLSIETPIGDEEDSRLGDLIEDKNALQPIDAAIQSDLREITTRVLASLTPREERILRMRFGIGMNKDHTLEEVGQQFTELNALSDVAIVLNQQNAHAKSVYSPLRPQKVN
jgi:RNA polymerase primary sigma factor